MAEGPLAKEFIPSPPSRRIVRRIAFAALALVAPILPIAPALACYSGNNFSVHFNSFEPDFGLPPRLVVIPWRNESQARDGGSGSDEAEGWTDGWSVGELDREVEEERQNKRLSQRNSALIAVRKAETAGKWRQARLACIQAAHLRNDGGLQDRIAVFRRVEADKSLRRFPAFLAALALYLDGMEEVETQPAPANAAFERVYGNPAAGFLRERALYQQASAACCAFDYPRAIALLQRLLREFPKTDERESALIMIARSAILPETPAGRDPAAGKQAVAQLLAQFPHTRFRRAAVGLQARLQYLAGEWSAALTGYFAVGDLPSVEIVRKAMPDKIRGEATIRLLSAYLRRLDHIRTFTEYAGALREADRMRRDLSRADAARFSQTLIRDPELAASYIYYRLYHCPVKPKDIAYLARLADAIAARYGPDKLSPPVRARLAEVSYRKGQYRQALIWAERAADSGLYDRALYVRGATLHKLKSYAGAIRDFRALIERCPRSSLRRGAREELAVLYETIGEPGRALEQYFQLRYQLDSAFLLDVRMTIPQIEALLRSPVGRSRRIVNFRSEERGQAVAPRYYTARNLILYSLGIRYLRAERWREAERALRRLPRAAYKDFSAGRLEWASRPSPDPISAAIRLGALQSAVAHTREARARALFRYGFYYSTHGTLLLYNSALWQDGRAFSFDFYWNKRIASRQDNAARRKHMYEHEVYARSRKILMEVARRYPRSSVAPAALYYAAYADRYLANFNRWWDAEDDKRRLWDEAIRLMRRIARRYPADHYAKRAREYLAQVAPNPKHNEEVGGF